MREVNQLCQCGVEVDQITNAVIRCFPESPAGITFRARISQTPLVLIPQLMELLAEMVSDEPLFIIRKQNLRVQKRCRDIVISSFEEEECVLLAPEDTNGTLPSALLFVGSIIGVAIIIVVVIIGIICRPKSMKKQSSTPR